MQIFESASSYVQGRNVLNQAGEHFQKLGDSALVLADEIVSDIVEEPLSSTLLDHGVEPHFVKFQGESTQKEVDRFKRVAEESDVEIISGAGGGKALDTAKAVGSDLGLPFVTLPTIASTDSPTSSISVLYSQDGEIENIQVNGIHPDLVLVDSGIIAQAPVRFFVAGIGDALATKFEARACYESGGKNILGGRPTQAALAIADRCYGNLRQHGLAAKVAVERDLVTPQVDSVIEANILLSGLGFENGGLALAHAVYNGFTKLGLGHEALHGEYVAFGTIVQLIAEGRDLEAVQDLVDFCASVSLPTTLKAVGLGDVGRPEIGRVGEKVVEQESKMRNEPVEVTPGMVADAIMLADEIGRRRSKGVT